MSVLIYIFLGFILFFIIVSLLTRRYNNPYKLIMIFGKKGCGKTTTLCKLCLKYLKQGWTVYSTEKIPGTYQIRPEQIGYISLKPHSVLVVDEVGMVYDSRNFREFRPEVRDFFKLQRHYKIRCYLFSQSFDIDKKLRDLTDEMFLLTNSFNVFSYGRRIIKRFTLTKSESDRPSSIAEDLHFDSILFFWAGSRMFTYIPKYAKYFDSFFAPNLATVELPYNIPKSLERKKWKLPKLKLSRKKS